MTKAERRRLLKQRVFRRDGHELELVELDGVTAVVMDEDGQLRRMAAARLLRSDDKRASAQLFYRRLRELGFDSYAAYLASPHWMDVRRRFALSGLSHDCFVCGERPTALHHRTYARLGREYLTDLQPLCRKHHTATHAHEREHGTDLWVAARRVKATEAAK